MVIIVEDIDAASIDQIQRGIVESNTSITSSNNDWSDRDVATESVTFDEPFDEAPQVVATVIGDETSNEAGIIVRVGDVSTTGCDVRISNYASTTSDNQTIAYIATQHNAQILSNRLILRRDQ